MTKYTKAISITFNDNDGGLSWAVNPDSAYDVNRYYKKYGKWKTRIMFLKAFWRGVMVMEKSYINKKISNNKQQNK